MDVRALSMEPLDQNAEVELKDGLKWKIVELQEFRSLVEEAAELRQSFKDLVKGAKSLKLRWSLLRRWVRSW